MDLPAPEIGADLRRTFLTANGVTLHVVEAGPRDGPPVVLLHGFPEFWYGWRAQIGPLARAGYRVIVPDQRGYHLSGKPRPLAAYAVRELAADVLALLDARGHREAAVVGHDWGAAVAWHLATHHPDRVARLAILNLPHPEVLSEALRANPAQRRRSSYMLFFQIPRLPEFLMGLGRAAPLARTLRESSRPGTFDGDLDAYRDAWTVPGALTGMLNWYRALRLTGDRAPTPRVTVPTLILWGARDRFLGRELAAPSAARCDDARLEFLEDATHWLHHEFPDEVNARLLAFLAEGGRA